MNRQQRRAAAKQSGKVTAAALCHAGFEHFRSGKIGEAELCCRQALAMDSQYADALHLKGVLCFQEQQYDAAAEWIGRAIAQVPKAEYFSSLGAVLQRQDRLEEAREAYEEALTLKPQEAFHWKNLGTVLAQLARTEEAVLHFQQALQLNPQYLEAANNCGLVLFDLGRYAEALEYFNVSEKLNPKQASLYHVRGHCLHRLKRFEDAQADYEKAISLDPSHAEAHNLLGSIHSRFGRMEQALACFDRALELHPNFPAALTDKAIAFSDMRLPKEAFALFDKSLTIDPKNARTIWNLSLLQLQTGDYERGWPGREERWKFSLGFVDRKFSKPLWLGEQPIKGKTILLHSEEGLGDTIMFARYVPMVAALGAQVILEVQPPLRGLLAGIPGVSICIDQSSSKSVAFDFHCPLGSLPLAFGTRFDTIPSPASYLPTPPAARVRAWGDRLGPRNRFRVGLVWSGNPTQMHDHNRSMALRTLAPLLDCNVQFVSLQKDVRDQDKALLAERSDILDVTEHLTDYTETAALISNLDLVMSVCTSVAHLAGALGAPVWTMLPFNAYYVWLLDRDDSPWYRSMKLFRQPTRGDWASVVDRVRLELEGLVSGRPGQEKPAVLPAESNSN